MSESIYQSSYRVINVHRHCSLPNERGIQAELEVLDRTGVAMTTILNGGVSYGHLPEWMELRKKHLKRLAVLSNVDWSRSKEPTFFEDIVKELEIQAQLGVNGVKVLKLLGMDVRGMGYRDAQGNLLKADDSRMDPFWERAGELGLPILCHGADPREYWYPLTYNTMHYGMRREEDQMYNQPGMPSWEELIRQRDAVLAKHPKTVIIGAHMGSMTFDLQGLEDRLAKYPNLYVDCSARCRILGRLNPIAVRNFWVRHQDRILFGTDSSILGRNLETATEQDLAEWKERATFFYSRYLAYFETDRVDLIEPYGYAEEWLRLSGAKLPPEVLEKFYHANAERLLPGLQE